MHPISTTLLTSDAFPVRQGPLLSGILFAHSPATQTYFGPFLAADGLGFCFKLLVAFLVAASIAPVAAAAAALIFFAAEEGPVALAPPVAPVAPVEAGAATGAGFGGIISSNGWLM